MRTPSIILASTLALAAVPAAAQAPPDYGLDFVPIGAAGNRNTLPHEVPGRPNFARGTVPYEYRIMRSKLNNVQYLEFVQAYAPYWQGNPTDPRLVGGWLAGSPAPGGGWTYSVIPGAEEFAAQMNWEMAARYTNWLHNGKVNAQWAFESGAYDTSTFQWEPGGVWHHQTVRSPDARFWIPSLDEWIKAVYYDPNRYGPGQEGYWQGPGSKDEWLIMGWPHEGGETIGELANFPPPLNWDGAWPLRQYPHVQTPWGLIDVSGTMPDYTEEVSGLGSIRTGGSAAGRAGHWAFDRIDVLSLDHLRGYSALRIATVIPAPGSVAVAIVVFGFFLRMSRR